MFIRLIQLLCIRAETLSLNFLHTCRLKIKHSDSKQCVMSDEAEAYSVQEMKRSHLTNGQSVRVSCLTFSKPDVRVLCIFSIAGMCSHNGHRELFIVFATFSCVNSLCKASERVHSMDI